MAEEGTPGDSACAPATCCMARTLVAADSAGARACRYDPYRRNRHAWTQAWLSVQQLAYGSNHRGERGRGTGLDGSAYGQHGTAGNLAERHQHRNMEA